MLKPRIQSIARSICSYRYRTWRMVNTDLNDTILADVGLFKHTRDAEMDLEQSRVEEPL